MAPKVQYLFSDSKNKMKKLKTGILINQMMTNLNKCLRRKSDDVNKSKDGADSELESQVSPPPNKWRCKKSTMPNKR
jgi:hypothetical protein